MSQPAVPTPPGSIPPPPKKKLYRGIVVVHGVGEHKKGSYVSGFVEEMAKYLCCVPELEDGKVQLTARNRTDTSDTSWARINIKNDGGEFDEEWHIREAWWTRTFQPSKPARIYLWAILAGVALMWSAFVQQFVRGFRSFRDKDALRREWPTERLGRPFEGDGPDPVPEEKQGVWRQPETAKGGSVLDAIIWAVFTLAYMVIGSVGIIVIGLVYIVLVLPLSLFFPAAANAVMKGVIKIIVFTLGDQEAMTTRQLALAAAANEVNNALWTMLSEDGLRGRRSNDPGFDGFETVTVVAHSGGCVVSMAALKSFEFARFRAEDATFSSRDERKFKRPERINWVTGGSGLNLAWNVRFGGTAPDTALWERPLERVNWLNVYSRYDPVAQGPAPGLMAQRLAGVDPRAPMPDPDRPDLVVPEHRPAFVALRVVNTDSPWGDHGSYWENHPEVMSRIVHCVTEDRLATQPLAADATAFTAKNLVGLSGAIRRSVETEMEPRRAKARKSVARTLAIGAVFVALAAWLGDDVGRWVLGNENFHFLQPWKDKEQPDPPSWQTWGIAQTGVGAAALGFVGMVVAQYLNIARWLRGYAAGARTDRHKRLWSTAAVVILVATLAILVGGLAAAAGTDVTWPWKWDWEWPWDWEGHA